jgi:outer membrane protein TolC/septal ring-binding cell division protein DamX
MQKILFLISICISLLAESSLPVEHKIDAHSQNYMGDIVNTEDYIKVSLVDVVLETVSQSNNAKAAREKVRQAKIKIDDAKAEYLPSIDGTYKFATTNTRPGVEDDDSEEIESSKSFNDESYKITLSQNLYKGGSTGYSVSSLEKKYEIAKNNYKVIVVKEIENAVKAYFDVLFNFKSLNVNIDNMVRLNEILDIINIKYESGAASIGNLSNVKASVSNAESKLIKVQSKFNESLEFYSYIVGDLFLKTFPYEDDFDTSVDDFDKLITQAINNNIKIKNFELNIESEKFNLMKAKSPFKPQVDLQLSGENILDQEDYENDEQNYKAQVIMTYNFYNKGKDKNKLLKINSIIRELHFRKNEEIRKLKWTLSKLHRSIISITNASISTKEEVSASENMVVAYWDGFKLGEQDLQELLQGQRQLNTAQLELISNNKSAITDYFKLLDKTGEILKYFRLDMDADNYIDFTKSHYINLLQKELEDTPSDIFDSVKSVDESIIDDLNTTISEDLNITDSMDNNATVIVPNKENDSLDSLLDFENKFLDSLPTQWTIWIHDFDKVYKALDFAKMKNMSEDIFVFDTLINNKIKSNIAYDIFDSEELAIQTLLDLNITDKKNEIITTQSIKDKYNDFKNRKFQTKVKVKKIKKFKTSPSFKREFLGAPKDYYTINITSFSSFKEAEILVTSEKIVDKSFIFNYGDDSEWTKVMYGVFDSYEKAKSSLDQLKSIKEKYEPIIETIESKQKLFNEYNNFEIEKVEMIEETPVEIEIETPTQNIEVNEVIEIDDFEAEPFESETIDANSYNNEEEHIYINDERSFKDVFLSAPSDSYSINLATLIDEEAAIKFTERYQDKMKFFIFKFGEDKTYYKVMTGVFSSKGEAYLAVENLDSNFRKNTPRVENISIKQNLYHKYNNELIMQEEK